MRVCLYTHPHARVKIPNRAAGLKLALSYTVILQAIGMPLVFEVFFSIAITSWIEFIGGGQAGEGTVGDWSGCGAKGG